jgi:CRP-like cAMP-binding protein
MGSANIGESISIIGGAIIGSMDAYFLKRKKNQRIDLKTSDNICYLLSGDVSIFRVEDDLLTVSLCSPAILGLAQMRNRYKSHYIRCNTDCEMWVISSGGAVDLFTENKIWNHAFDILTGHLQLYFERESTVSQKRTKEVVVEHLKNIWLMDDERRAKTSLYSYIMKRSHLSRSGIHKALSDLVKDELVEVVRGKLIAFKQNI